MTFRSCAACLGKTKTGLVGLGRVKRVPRAGAESARPCSRFRAPAGSWLVDKPPATVLLGASVSIITPVARAHVGLFRQSVPPIGLSIERKTPTVPDDGWYYVVLRGVIKGRFRNMKQAEDLYRALLAESGYRPPEAKRKDSTMGDKSPKNTSKTKKQKAQKKAASAAKPTPGTTELAVSRSPAASKR